jgi:hypothetical protein
MSGSTAPASAGAVDCLLRNIRRAWWSTFSLPAPVEGGTFIVQTSLKLRSTGKRAVAASLCGLSLICSLSGCGGSSAEPPKTPRVNASGKVEFDGQPLAAGTVTFVHEEKGNTSACDISGGEFATEEGEGPTPGPNVVQVQAQTEDGKQMWAAAWRTKVTIGEGDYTETFKIESKDVKPYDPNAASQKGLDAGDTYDVGS